MTHSLEHTAQILDGNKASIAIKEMIKQKIQQRIANKQTIPGLAVLLVGENAASKVYVAKKKSSCEEVGILSSLYQLPHDVEEDRLLALIQQLNNDPKVHGILVQLPLPAHLSTDKVIETIRVDKDVDGFHPFNIGLLALKKPVLRPCTPKGIMLLIEKTGIDLAGKEAVIIGTSNIVGKPMVLELMMKNATVTVCNSKTKDLASHVARADILVVAIGKPGFIPGAWIKQGAVVIDVGINRLPNGKLAGDVHFESAKEKAAWITPVPGGVGPMTVACLLENTLKCLETIESKI